MKHSLLLIWFSFLLNFFSFAQDSIIVVQKGQILKYRKGYIITTQDDTIRGLIYHESDSRIFFIKEGQKVKTPVVGNFSIIPSITATEGSKKGFCRNGLFYTICCVPPDNNPVFLTVLEKGQLTLYCLLSNYSDQQLSNQMVTGGGLLNSMVNMTNYDKNNDDEYYDVKAYYVRKTPNDQLILIPKGEKKFRDAFVPLIRDNHPFVQGLVGQTVDYYHLRSLIKQYNTTSQKN
jgi:hypothetical protein